MTRFKDIKVNTAAATVEVGAGLTWDQVYLALEPYGVSVVGGRVPGIGVAGLTLGGGEQSPSAHIPVWHKMADYVQVFPGSLDNTGPQLTTSQGMSLSYRMEPSHL